MRRGYVKPCSWALAPANWFHDKGVQKVVITSMEFADDEAPKERQKGNERQWDRTGQVLVLY